MPTQTMRTLIDEKIRARYNGNRRSELMEPAQSLQSLDLFRDLSEPALRQLAATARRRTFEAGEVIFHQGAPGATCHVIESGKVRVFVIGEDGRELAMRLLGAGEIIGEMAVFEDLPRSANVEALEETQTLELHRDALIQCLEMHPALSLRLLRDLSARLRRATEEAEGLALLTVSERLLRRLEQLARWAGRPVGEGVQIALPLTQHELATLTGTSRESVNRALSRLRQQGRIRLQDGWIILTDQAP